MHAGLENIIEVFHSGILVLLCIADAPFALLPILVDDYRNGVRIKGLHHTPLVRRILPKASASPSEIMGQERREVGGDVRSEDAADEPCHSSNIIEKVGLSVTARFHEMASVAVTPRLPQGISLVGGDAIDTYQTLQLGVEVTKAIMCIFQSFGTDHDEGLMEETDAHGGRRSFVTDDGTEIGKEVGRSLAHDCSFTFAASHSRICFFRSLPQWYSPKVPSLWMTR